MNLILITISILLGLIDLTTSQSSSSTSNTCTKVTCATTNSNKNCTISNYPTLLAVDNSACANDQICYINKRFDGTCVKRTTYSEPNALYPGQSCTQGDKTNVCLFGPMECGDDGRCVGLNINQACVRTADCNYGFYCLRGFCSPTLDIGDQCTTSDACGRTGYCYYSSLDATAGVCTNYFSMDDGDTVGVNVSGTIIVQTGAEKLCRNQMVNASNGNCNQGLKSLSKGLNCTTDRDCNTSDPNVFASCKCGFNTGGTKYCDVLGGDDEWVNANNAFTTYFMLTQDCHPGAGWSQCGRPAEFQAWKCAQFQAENYVNLISNPTCVQSMYDQFPEFADYAKYCLSGLMLQASLFVALIAGLVSAFISF